MFIFYFNLEYSFKKIFIFVEKAVSPRARRTPSAPLMDLVHLK